MRNSSYEIEIAQDQQNWQVSAASFNQYYASINPKSFAANKSEQIISINYQENMHNKYISGYWENWKNAYNPGEGSTSDASYYKNDIEPMTHVYYSFLNLAKNPNPYSPPASYWNGEALYESISAENVLTVMTKTDPLWSNPAEWQRVKIAALIEAVNQNNGKFIWAIGGWSDVTKTITPNQVDNFVNQCVELLKLSGDGIDFDWEHLSQDASIRDEQLQTLANVLLKLRQALDQAGLSDKEIGYTTRFNAFWNNTNQPENHSAFASDGEGLEIENYLNQQGSSLNDVVDWVNIMMYDVPPSNLGSPNGFTLENYKVVFNAFEKYIDKDKIVMGFEPGGQAAGGQWEGLEVDKDVIDYIQQNGYGGVMFGQLINQRIIQPKLRLKMLLN